MVMMYSFKPILMKFFVTPHVHMSEVRSLEMNIIHYIINSSLYQRILFQMSIHNPS